MKRFKFLMPIVLALLVISFAGGYIFNEKQAGILNAISLEAKHPEGSEEIMIGEQPAIFKKSKSKNMPLVVSLHSWSADYQQADSLSSYISDLDWNYIRPDFQGPNNNPNATGSDLVVSDIDDAIDFALINGEIDEDNIFIVGESGGGYTSLVHFMKSTYDIKGYLAWVPMTDLESWYYESLGRRQIYADDIFNSTSEGDRLNTDETEKRSPIYMETPLEKLEKSKVYIFAGIHDGYNGSVPITHSLNFYNKLAKDNNAKIIDNGTILDLVTKRTADSIGVIQDRDVYLKESFSNVSITIFEGGHELLPEVAIDEMIKMYKN